MFLLKHWCRIGILARNGLTHLFPMHPFPTPFQRVEKGCIGNNWVNKRGTEAHLVPCKTGMMELFRKCS